MITIIQDDFDLSKIIQSGQCFRGVLLPNGWYRFTTRHCILYIRNVKGLRYEVTCSEDDWKKVWYPYFELERSYSALRNAACGKQAFVTTAIEAGKGLRVLRQDPWEMLITFIISQRKSIPAIARAVDGIARLYGEKVQTDFEELYLFPTATEMAGATKEQLQELGIGYRIPDILDAIKKENEGDVNLLGLEQCSDEGLLQALQTIRGVGTKVANCVALFAYGRMGCVPIDVWIARAIQENCGGKSPFEQFGDIAGIIQQYVFYYQQTREK